MKDFYFSGLVIDLLVKIKGEWLVIGYRKIIFDYYNFLFYIIEVYVLGNLK